MKTGLSCAALAQSMGVSTNMTNRRTCYFTEQGANCYGGDTSREKKMRMGNNGRSDCPTPRPRRISSEACILCSFRDFCQAVFYRHHLRRKRCSASRVLIEFMKHRGAMVQWETEDGAVRGPASAKTCLASPGRSCMWPSNVTRRCVHARGH